jgi:localization factor PodJL
VSAVDPDTWEAAREAARQSGLSVGEWLEAAIRENARGGHGRSRSRNRSPATNFDHRLDDLAEQINMLSRRNVYVRPNPQAIPPRDTGSEQIASSLDALTDRIDQMLDGMERAQRNNGRDEISAAIRKLDSRIGSILSERPASNQDSEVETKLDEMARVISQMSERLEREVAAAAVPQQAPTADELDAAVAEIMERQSRLDGTPYRRAPAGKPAPAAPQNAAQFAAFERQLKTIADEMQSLRKSQAKNAQATGPISELRRDIAELAQTMAELAPRRTLESLEHTVEALARKLDRQTQNSKQDNRSVQAVLTSLDEIRTALSNVRPQESFISVEGDLNALSEKLDVINAKSIDGTTVARIQNQIQEVRELLSNALPAENLQAVVAQIETIASKVERAASPDDNGVRDIVSGLERRIDSLAHRIESGAHLSPGSEALDRIHQRLDSLQMALDKAENPMGLEETMRNVVARLDASEAKLAGISTIERGITDLSAQFDKARANAMDVAERAAKTALRELQAARQTMPQQVAAAQSEGDKPAPKPLAGDPVPPRKVTQIAAPAETQQRFTRTPPVTVRSSDEFVATDGLPADFPLEPGSGAPRSRATPVQQRIAQSEAAVAEIAPRANDANAKTSDFIAAARRAAQAAAAEATAEEAQGGTKKGALQGIFARSRRAVLLGLVVAMLGFSAVRFFDLNLISGLIGGRETPAQAPAPEPAAAPQTQAPAPGPLSQAMPDVPPEVQQRSLIPGIINPVGNLAPPAGEITPQRMVSLYSHPPLDALTTQSTKQPPRAPLQTQANVSSPPQAQTGNNDLPPGVGNAALRQAALNGNADAAFEIGERYLNGQGVTADPAEALKWFERAAAKGSPGAAFRLGMAYEKGHGTQKDRARAKTNYVLAAESGHLKAMHNLAVMIVEDSSTPGRQPDYNTAIPWFRKAAERGLRDSQYNLGVLYARGLGVPQNLAESFRWFSLAANQGDAEAAKKRDDVAARLDQQTLVAQRLAVQTWAAQPSDESVNAPRAKPEWQDAAAAPKKKQKK